MELLRPELWAARVSVPLELIIQPVGSAVLPANLWRSDSNKEMKISCRAMLRHTRGHLFKHYIDFRWVDRWAQHDEKENKDLQGFPFFKMVHFSPEFSKDDSVYLIMFEIYCLVSSE